MNGRTTEEVWKMNSELKMYGLTISTEEAYQGIQDGRMDELMKCAKAPAVYQDPNGQYQMLLFDHPDKRSAAYHKAHDLGFSSAAYVVQRIYVDMKYLKLDEKNMKDPEA